MKKKQNVKQTRNIVVTSHNIQFLEKVVNGDEKAIKELALIIEEKKRNSKRVCPMCGAIFSSNNFQAKYCDKCRKKPISERRKGVKQSTRYIHKRIWDRINLSKKYDRDFLNAFMNESNYYWHTIKGKKCKIEKKEEYLDIRTEEEYREWLINKLDELGSRNKA